MNVSALLTEIDAEITRLQKARAALLGIGGAPVKRGPGRPKVATSKPGPKKRILSPEARAKIAAAQKKRWATARKAK